jgi:2-polyprenyl-3-methyl-5-hydroxy-6-metoxy-1,4-benzoquinol methylase
MKTSSDLVNELQSFQKIWNGGYRTGYNAKRNQAGLESYLKETILPEHNVFEIGCGGGQWTKLLSSLANTVICNDAKTLEDNELFPYLHSYNVGKNVSFFQAKNFDLDQIPDNSLDIVFSYDVFCHISLSGQREYIRNLYNKCKRGCLLMIMIADAHKYAQSEPEHIHLAFGHTALIDLNSAIENTISDCDGKSAEGRWYFVGLDNFIAIVQENNYSILTKDLCIDKTNPIVLFTKL